VDLVFKIDDIFYQKLVCANAHNHPIPSSNGVKPDYTDEEWLFEYYKRSFLAEVSLYDNAVRDPLPKPDPGNILQKSLDDGKDLPKI
jgi:hypothetical protein